MKDFKPELLDPAVFDALNKDQRKKYRTGALTKTDAVLIAKGVGTGMGAGTGSGLTSSLIESGSGVLSDGEDADLTMNQREFEVSFVKFFEKQAMPKPGIRGKNAEELLRQHLTKGPRANADAAEKIAQIAELRAAMEATPNETSRNVLQKEITELEAQVEAHSLGGSEHSRAATDKAAYEAAKAKLCLDRERKAELRRKKDLEAETNAKKILRQSANCGHS